MTKCALCGHIEEEHEDSFTGPCLVEGCDCELFDPIYEDEEEDYDYRTN